MTFPHNTILIAVVNASVVPPDKRPLTHFMAPVETQWRVCYEQLVTGWHITTNVIYWQTHLLTATLKSSLLLVRFQRNAWFLTHWEGGPRWKLGCGTTLKALFLDKGWF